METVEIIVGVVLFIAWLAYIGNRLTNEIRINNNIYEKENNND